MEIFFYVVPMLMIAVASCAVVVVIRRSVRVSRAWNSGLIAEGRCLRTYATTGGGGDSSVRTTLQARDVCSPSSARSSSSPSASWR